MVRIWYLASKVNSSKYRKQILILLSKEIKTPTDLEKEINLKISHVSRALKELSRMKLVKCLTPRARKSRLYIITLTGKKVLKSLKV